LYGKELVAVDGTKIRASSSRRNIHTQKGTEKELASVEKKISEYLSELESNDAYEFCVNQAKFLTEAGDARLDAAALHEALKRLQEKKDKLADWLTRIEANGGAEISTVDPDAQVNFAWYTQNSFMHSGGDARPLDACYSVQAVADAKHKLIVDFDVSTCPEDKGILLEPRKIHKGRCVK
jgi:hypothetical protein